MNVKKQGIVPNTSSRARSFLNFPMGKNKKAKYSFTDILAVIGIVAVIIMAIAMTLKILNII